MPDTTSAADSLRPLLRRIDLNLFRVFEAVMQYRTISRAAADLRITPSAVSHALARLRLALDDELFIAGAGGMTPTARALELAPGIRNGLGSIEAAVGAVGFDPATAIRTFRLAASDYACSVLLAPLVARLMTTAPQVDLRVFPVNRTDVIRHLDEGRVDMVIGWFDDLPDRLERVPILTDREAIVVRSGHPLTTVGIPTREALLAYPHVVVELTGSEGQAEDGFFDERGAARRIWLERLLLETTENGEETLGRAAVSVPHFGAVPSLLLATDMVATLPRRLAEKLTPLVPLAILPLPYAPLEVTLELVSHQRGVRDPGVRWLIGEMTVAGAGLDRI